MAATTRTHGITPKTVDRKAPPKKKAPATSPEPVDDTPVAITTQGMRCLFMHTKGSCAVNAPAGPVKLDIAEGGIYLRPEGLDDGEWLARVRFLVATGDFEDISETKIAPPAPEPTIFIFAHPDNEEAGPKQGSVMVDVQSGTVELELDEDGTVRTEDPIVAIALLKKGYLEAGTKPRE